jgi:uncharacterized membrane protein
MRYFIGGQMGIVAFPFIVLVGVAYAWVMERLLAGKAKVAKPEEETSSVKKAA